MKQIIAVDIDEVLMPFHEPFLRHHNQMYGTAYAYPDPQDRYFLEDFTGEPSHVVEAKITAYASQAFATADPLHGAPEAISRIKAAGYGLVVITARTPAHQESTQAFVDRHFASLFSDVYFIPHYAGSALTPAAGKLQLCHQVGARYLIDDNLNTVKVIAESGLTGIVFGNYHWNRADALPTGVVRCADWQAVANYLEAA